MAKEKVNVKEQHDENKISQELIDFLTKLRTKIENDGDNRIAWKRKLVTSNNQRLGVKRVSTRPWVGAPNIPLPETDKLITKQKPSYVLSVLIPRKKAFVVIEEGTRDPDSFEDKRKRAELGLNHVLNNKIDLLTVFGLGSDNFLEKGSSIFKVIERFKEKIVNKVIDLDDFPEDSIKALRKMSTENLKMFIAQRYDLDQEDEDDKKILDDIIEQFKSGNKIIEFQITEIESYPDIIVRPTEKVTPPAFAESIENVERLVDEFFLSKRELIEKARQGIYDKKLIDKFEDDQLSGKGKSSTEDDMIDTQKETNEGVIDEGNDELFRIQEVYCWWRENEDKDKPFERWVFTFLADVASVEEALIQKIRYPYELDTWNFVKHDNEIKDSRWHSSRGIPEQIRALQEFMEKGINNLLIRDEINNAPIYTVLANSSIQANSVRFIPGQKVKVKAHNEIARLDDINKVDISSERLIQLLKAFTEEYKSSTDQLFRNATNRGGGKTLGEVQLGVQLTTGPLTLDVLRWMKTVQKLYTMIFKLLHERLGESMYINGMEITREDFNIPVMIIPNGSLDLAESQIRRQKALERLTLTSQLPPEISTIKDKYNAAFDFFEADGVRDPDRYVTDPEITAQIEQQGLAQEEAIISQQEEGLDREIAQKRREALADRQTSGGTRGRTERKQSATSTGISQVNR